MGNDTMKENNSKMIILIVDDSSFSRNMINKELIEMGFDDDQIYQAASGEEALVKFKEKIIDVVLLDIVLTGIDGIETLKEMKKLNPNVRVIMCSGCNSDDLIKESVKLGIDAFIVKPYKSEMFKNIISQVLPEIKNGFNATKNKLNAKCHICNKEMVEVDSIDMISFFCPKNCMRIGTISNVLLTQEELNNDYLKNKRNQELLP